MPLDLHRLLRRHRAAWGTLLIGLVATAALGWQLHREAVVLDRQRLALRVAEITAQLDARLEKSEMLLHNLRDYLLLSGENRGPVFERWCYENGLSINCRWLHGIAVATNRHAVQWRSQLPQDPRSWTTNDLRTINRLAFAQPIQCDIALRSELGDQKQFLADYGLGRTFLDADSNWSGDWLAVTIRQSTRLGMSEHRTVMLDADGNAVAGTLFYVPIHSPEITALTTLETLPRPFKSYARWLDLKSLIVAPVDFKALEESIRDGEPADVGVELFSSTNQTAETWLNLSGGSPHATDPHFKPYLTQQHRWRMYGLTFSMFFYTTTLFEAQSPRRLARIAVAAGTALTLLAAALVGVAQRARNQQEEMTEQIREARDALTAAQQEREEFSRDLHDGTVQSLYAIQLALDHTVENLETGRAHERRALSAVRSELDAVIGEIRQFISAETRANQPVDFSAVLQALLQRARAGKTVAISSRCDSDASGCLTANQAVQLANIIREALSNSLRHAKPQKVGVALFLEDETVVLEISDDGTGFDPKSPGLSGFGLTSMMARTREMNGTLKIHSSSGKGTRVVVRVPTAPLESHGENWPPRSTEAS